MKKSILCLLVVFLVFAGAVDIYAFCKGYGPDYAESTEVFRNWWWYYDGHLQFQPIYTTPADADPNVIRPNSNVCRGYINYTRKDKSVCGGRQYTECVSNVFNTNIYSVDKTVSDSANLFGNQTKFSYDWWYLNPADPRCWAID